MGFTVTLLAVEMQDEDGENFSTWPAQHIVRGQGRLDALGQKVDVFV